MFERQMVFQTGASWNFSAEESLGGRADPAGATKQPDRQKGHQLKVLIVDDQRLIADTLAEILENAGFDPVAAYDGFEALEKAARFHPDWILSDVLMPRMNGVELAIAIRKNYPSSAILLLSGQAGISGILEDGRRQGYQFELIAKPIHPLKLIDRIKKLE